MTPRSDQVRNRAALVAAARELFGRRGLEVPLDEVARAAGVGNATLYRHFPDRRALLVAVVLARLERHQSALTEALAQDSGWDGLVSILGFMVAEQVDEVGHLGALRAIPAGENAEIDHARSVTVARLAELVDRAKAEGRFRADRFPEDVHLLLFVAAHAGDLGATTRPAATRRMIELFLASVSAAPPAPGPATETADVLTLRRTLVREGSGLPPLD